MEHKRKWPSIRESLERASKGIIWDYTDSISGAELDDEEWAAHMAEVYELIEESPEREQLLALVDAIRARNQAAVIQSLRRAVERAVGRHGDAIRGAIL